MKERTINYHNWSGDDVFSPESLPFLLDRFNKIFYSLSSKHQDSLLWLQGSKGKVIKKIPIIFSFKVFFS